MNECASTRDEFRSSFDKLKSIITDPVIEIEPKGLNSYEAKNIGNYVIVSNHDDSVVIEDSDRRYQVLSCSDVYLNNTEYFGRVRKILQLDDDTVKDAANSFYTYLMQYKDKVNLFQIIDSPMRQEMKNRSLPSTVRYIKEYIETMNILKNEDADKWQYLSNIKAVLLYQKYVEWAKESNEKIMSNTKFGTDIKNYVVKSIKKDATYYIFH
jgi:phage/plasmid-associated DNA primase